MYSVHNEDLSKKAYDAIKIMILNGNLPPGAKLYQEKLAEELGISRTPLNGALNQLEKEMLVISLPRRGFYVNELTLSELVKLYEIRKRLDPLCVSDAASSTDINLKNQCAKLSTDFNKFRSINTDIQLLYDFYSIIISMSGNNFLKNMMTSYNLISLVNLHKYVGKNILSDEKFRNPEEYKLILELIKDNSPEEAEKAMKKHITNVYNILLKAEETEL